MYIVDKNFEKELRKMLIARDGDAWTLFYDSFLNPIYEYVYYRVRGNQAAAEDIVQTVFLEAIKNIDTYDPERASLYTWFKGIVRHHLFRYYRKVKKENHIEEVAEREIWNALNDKERIPVSRKRLEEEEQKRLIESVLAALPPQYRAVLVKKYTEDETLKEIAREYSTTPKAIEMLIYRAKRTFKKIYKRMR